MSSYFVVRLLIDKFSFFCCKVDDGAEAFERKDWAELVEFTLNSRYVWHFSFLLLLFLSSLILRIILARYFYLRLVMENDLISSETSVAKRRFVIQWYYIILRLCSQSSQAERV